MHHGTTPSKIPEVMVSPPTLTPLGYESQGRSEEDEARDYQEFLDKARKDVERAEKKRLREIKAAREVNMSPWARMM